jgi:hypothetical protein
MGPMILKLTPSVSDTIPAKLPLDLSDYDVKRIFKYPSRLHKGEELDNDQ